MNLKNIIYSLLFLNLIVVSSVYSQNYSAVDSVVDGYSKTISNVDDLVELINKDFSQPDEKARAIFRWVATNVSYDVDLSASINHKSLNVFSYKTEKEKEIKEKIFKLDLVSTTMNTKKTVCHGYAALIEYLYSRIGLENRIVYGNLKTNPSQIGEVPDVVNHAWNAVKIRGEWKYVDATLAAGYISGATNLFKFYFNDSYFFTNPKRFFLNHYPIDEKEINVGISEKDFASYPVFLVITFKIIMKLLSLYQEYARQKIMQISILLFEV